MTVWITLDYKGWFAEMARQNRGLSREARRLLLTESNRAVVKHWHARFIPRHFEVAARSRYHYQKRKKKYKEIKRELASGKRVFVHGQEITEQVIKGGKVDIVRRGRTERKAEQPVAVSASAFRATARFPVPRYIVARYLKKPNQKRELQKLTKGERIELVELWRTTFYRNVKRYGRAARRVRKKIK